MVYLKQLKQKPTTYDKRYNYLNADCYSYGNIT